jgi:hypothetical protein
MCVERRSLLPQVCRIQCGGGHRWKKMSGATREVGAPASRIERFEEPVLTPRAVTSARYLDAWSPLGRYRITSGVEVKVLSEGSVKQLRVRRGRPSGRGPRRAFPSAVGWETGQADLKACPAAGGVGLYVNAARPFSRDCRDPPADRCRARRRAAPRPAAPDWC